MFIVQIVFVVCFNIYPSNRNCSAIQRLQICCEYLISAKSCSCFMCCRLSAPPSFFPHDMKVRSRSSEETAGIIWPRFWRSNKSTKFANSHKGVNIWSESCVKVVPKLWKWGRGLPKSVEVVPKFYQSCLKVLPKLSQSSTKVVSHFDWALRKMPQRNVVSML